ncbi:MAG: tetraacyldisaccharide 4'-kinase [Bacteroidetes bacterium]|nr:MAG: tetraacyldisaccharide 4'-kinase [Bacteroidota bacterium]
MNFQTLIKNNLYKRSLLSYLLLPISGVYTSVQIFRRKWYKTFPSKIYRSEYKIISIGNIVSGGSGKTPFTIFLTKYLTQKGFSVAISHRGYKGKFEKENKLISNKKEVFDFAQDAGDEAFLLATKLDGIPIVVGKNRSLSIEILTHRFPELDYIILDDSFQNLKIHHYLDIVVFNQIGGIGNGWVLPSGILRESLSALRYTDIIVFNGTGKVPSELEKAQKPILKGSYIITRVLSFTKKMIQLKDLKGKKIILLSGIGLPQSFEETVKRIGIKFTKHICLPDHFSYENNKIFAELQNLVVKENINFILTTEKDFSKIQYKNRLNLPFIIIEIEFQLENEELLNHFLL